jgi:ubiquinone biosynthesis protein
MGIPEKLREFKRFRDILRVSAKFGFSHVLSEKFHRGKDLDPARLRRALEDLGGTFVKLGQHLSLRPDLIPERYCRELARLQDRVKPFSRAEAEAVIKKELSHASRLLEVKELVASASIGQVYRAEMNGISVAVKVMRPDIEKTMADDLLILFHLAGYLKKKYGSSVIDPIEIYEQFKIYTENELDYIREAKNIEAIGKNFEKTSLQIPHVYWQCTTKRVLTMEFIDGKRIDKVKFSRAEREGYVRSLVQAVFKQIFIDGIFHADPHPGNILVTRNKQLALIDFGIVGRIDDSLRSHLAVLFVSLVAKDMDAIVDSFIRLNLLEYTVDRQSFKEDLSRALGKYYGNDLRHIDMGVVIMQSFEVAKKHHIRLPKDYVLLGKSIITLEGVARSLWPSFNIVDESKPFVSTLIKQKFGVKEFYLAARKNAPRFAEFLAALPDKSNTFLSEVHGLDEKLKLLERDIVRLDSSITRGTNRLVMGIIIAALVISFALIVDINKTYAVILLCLALLLLLDLFVMMFKERWSYG